MTLSNHWRGILVLSLAVTFTLAAAPAFAQRDVGTMLVRALDPDGAPLPGVMVVASGPVGTQTQYTGVDGTARFPGLYPGSGYKATFSLDGFKTVIREDLAIRVSRTTAFDVTMELATVEETITVTGESPLVDVKSTNVGTSYNSDMIDKAPTASGLWAGVLDHVPGVINSNIDVGGSNAGQQSVPTAFGSEWGNNSYNINGADTTDPAAVGASSFYYATGSFEEVGVSAASHDIEVKTPGINMNMVVKSGSNDWHAGVKMFYENESMVSSNVDDALRADGVEEGTPNELLRDIDVQGGGPIVPNRAWFFVDYWNFEIRKAVLGIEERDQTKLENWTLNGNVQINDNHKASLRYLTDRKYRNNRGASRTNPYLGRIQDSFVDIPQMQWQAVLSQNMFLDVRFSKMDMEFPLEARDADSSNPLPGWVDRPARYDFNTGWVQRPSNPTNEFLDQRDNSSLHATTSYYLTGDETSHDVKFGFDYQKVQYFAPDKQPNGYRPYVRSSLDPMGNPNWALGVPVEVRLYNSSIEDVFSSAWNPDNAYLVRGSNFSLYGQDTLTIANKATITFGARWDLASNYNPAQNRLTSPWCGSVPLNNPERFCEGSFGEQPTSVRWSDIVPRIGLIYDVKGDGRWAVKANYSRYNEALGIRFAGATNVNSIGREDWNWTDANGDGIFQFGENTGFRDQNFPGLGTSLDPDLTSPWVDEVTFGLDHELADNILVSITGIWRAQSNDTGTANIGRPFGPMFASDRCQAECTPVLPFGVDPWAPVQTVDPGNDGIIGNGDDGGPITVWALNPATFGTTDNLSTNTEAWGFNDGTEYTGMSLQLQKRWSNNWQMMGSYDYGRGYFVSASTSPNGLFNNRRQEAFGSRPHNFRLTTNYLIAEPIGVNLGLFIRAYSGEPVQATYSYDDSVIEPPNGPFGNQSNTTIVLDARGEGNTVGSVRPEREDFLTIVDIRAEKQVTVGRYGILHFYFDVFNTFNANTITEFRWRVGSRYQEIQDILPPRVMRIGGAWDF